MFRLLHTCSAYDFSGFASNCGVCNWNGDGSYVDTWIACRKCFVNVWFFILDNRIQMCRVKIGIA